eukprot:404043_1
MTCPQKHQLRRFTTSRFGFGCDWCKQTQPQFTTLFGCRACDYDLCVRCLEKQRAHVKTFSRLRDLLQDDNFSDDEVSTVRCTKGHKLEVMFCSNFQCGGCGYNGFGKNHQCEPCKYNRCEECYTHKKQLTKSPNNYKTYNVIEEKGKDTTEKLKQLQFKYEKELQKCDELEKNKHKLRQDYENLQKLYKKKLSVRSEENHSLRLKNDAFRKQLIESEKQYELSMTHNRSSKATILKLNDDYKDLEYSHNELKQRYEAQKSRLGYQVWDFKDIVEWITQLENGRFAKYEEILLNSMKEEEIDGCCLSDLNENDMFRMGVKSFRDKKAIIKNIQSLIFKSDKNTKANDEQSKFYDAEGNNTAFI